MNCKGSWHSEAGFVLKSVVLLAAIVASFSPLAAWAATQPQFSAPIYSIQPGMPGAMAAGDFNGDGKLDLVKQTAGTYLALLLGRGDGTFSTTTNCYALADFLATGDFNGDGKLDVFAVGHSLASIFLGNGAGGWSLRTNYLGWPQYPGGLAAADMDTDGKLDVVWPAGAGCRIAFGNGDGTFTNRPSFPLGTYGTALSPAVVDCNGDGQPDLVFAFHNYPGYSSNSFCVLLNAGNGAFSPPQFYPDSGYEDHSALTVGDFTGDGRSDVAVSDDFAQTVSVWTNIGAGAFAFASTYKVGFTGRSLACADLSGDGTLELVVGGSSLRTLRILVGDGRGGFTLSPLMPMSFPLVIVGDFNNDGMLDLASRGEPSGAVAVLLNQTPPTLRLTPMLDYVQLDWLATFGAGFSLEYSTNLTDPTSWRPFPYPPVAIGHQRAITDWSTEARRFYRLRRP